MSKDIGQEFGLDLQVLAKNGTKAKRKHRGLSSIHIVRDLIYGILKELASIRVQQKKHIVIINELLRVAEK